MTSDDMTPIGSSAGLRMPRNEKRYVAGSRGHRNLREPCHKCGKPITSGDKVVSRHKGRNRSTNYYHEECWEKLRL